MAHWQLLTVTGFKLSYPWHLSPRVATPQDSENLIHVASPMNLFIDLDTAHSDIIILSVVHPRTTIREEMRREE